RRPRARTRLLLPLDAAPAPGPDVLLQVHHHRLGGGPGELHFALFSSRADLDDLPTLGGDLGQVRLHADLAPGIHDLLGRLAALARASGSPSAVEQTLADTGQLLFAELVPRRLAELCWAFAERGVRSLMVLSDEAHVPWELVQPFRIGRDGGVEEGEA